MGTTCRSLNGASHQSNSLSAAYYQMAKTTIFCKWKASLMNIKTSKLASPLHIWIIALFPEFDSSLVDQILTDQLWGHFIKIYLPALQHCQKWHGHTENIISAIVVMIVCQPPRALWPASKLKYVYLSADCKWSCKRQPERVSHLIKLPPTPDDHWTLSITS